MAKGFIQKRPTQTGWAMALFIGAIVLNYQNLLLVPFIIFNLLFFGLTQGRMWQAGPASAVFCGLLGAFVVFCRNNLISAFGMNVTGAHAASTDEVLLADHIHSLTARLITIFVLVGVPTLVCVTGCLVVTGLKLLRSGLKFNWHHSHFSNYAAGTGITALTIPGLFLVSSNQSSAVKYLIDVLVMVSPLFLVAVTRTIGLVTASIDSKRLGLTRRLVNMGLVMAPLIALVSYMGNNCLSRFAWNYDYEGIMKRWIPLVYAGKAKGLVFGSDWYPQTFVFAGGDLALDKDFAFVNPRQLPERPEGKYGAIRMADEASRDYWTDPTLVLSQFDYLRFLRERDSRLDAIRPFLICGLLIVLVPFVALHFLATTGFPHRGEQPGMLRIACYFCKEHIEFPAYALGTKIRCPHCKRDIALKEPA